MIFVTAGSVMPFDRLFQSIDKAVLDGVIEGPVFGQIGNGTYLPKHFSYQRFLQKADFDSRMSTADLIVGHAGIGTITQAMSLQKSLMVMARRGSLGEHVNDHQVETAIKFSELGHLLCFDENDLADKLREVKEFTPVPRSPNVQGVSDAVARFLSGL
jgi:UDP-N-acetylglucosamine transferase subunit ALG13